MTFKYYNRVQMTVSGTPGTGTITLGSAVAAYQSFSAAGASNGDTFSYLLLDGVNWELGIGTYNSSGPTVSRTTVTDSSNSGSAISATSSALVMATLRAEDATNKNMPILTPPTSSQLSALQTLNSSVLTSISGNGPASLNIAAPSSIGATNACSILQTAPATPYTLTMKAKTLIQGSASWNGCGPMLYNSGNSHLIVGVRADSAYLALTYMSNATTWQSNYISSTSPCDPDFYTQVTNDGTNLTWGISSDGVTFLTVFTEAVTAHIGAVTHVGCGWFNGTGNNAVYQVRHYNIGASGTGIGWG